MYCFPCLPPHCTCHRHLWRPPITRRDKMNKTKGQDKPNFIELSLNVLVTMLNIHLLFPQRIPDLTCVIWHKWTEPQAKPHMGFYHSPYGTNASPMSKRNSGISERISHACNTRNSWSMSSNLPQQKENYMAELNQQLPTFVSNGAKFLAHAHITLPVCANSSLHPSAPNLQSDML